MKLKTFLKHIAKFYGGESTASAYAKFHSNKLDLMATDTDWHINFWNWHKNIYLKLVE